MRQLFYVVLINNLYLFQLDGGMNPKDSNMNLEAVDVDAFMSGTSDAMNMGLGGMNGVGMFL